jgi:hypothetical protein
VTTRRQFLKSTAAVVAATAYTPSALGAAFDPSSWSSVRDQFLLDDGVTNLTTFLLASHPKAVRDATTGIGSRSTGTRSATSTTRRHPLSETFALPRRRTWRSTRTSSR